MRILITGGNGFIGTHLQKALQDEEVFVFDRDRISGPGYFRGDICDYFSLEKVFEEIEPQIVVHLAAMVSRMECEETPAMAIQTNVEGTLNVAKLCERFESRLVYAGSSEEYGTAFNSGKVVDEDTPFGTPTSMYSMTKRMSEELIQYHAMKTGVPATTLRFFMLYGPGEKPSDYRSAIIRFIEWARTGQPMIVHKGTERSWCYIDDAVDAICRVIFRKPGKTYDVFNIGKDDPVATEELAGLIRLLTNSESEIQIHPVAKTIIPVKRASFTKAERILGWKANTPLKRGLIQVIANE